MSPLAAAVVPDGEIAEKLRALRSPATYPVPAPQVDVIETHFAWVFLVGEHAFKLKKPVDYRELRLRSVEARRANCIEELRLNRRLAPDVYLDVTPLARGADGTLHLRGEGDAVDWLVHMKRLPAALMLDRALAAGTASPMALQAVGSLLSSFYRRQPAVTLRPDEYVARLVQQIEMDGSELAMPELQLNAARVQTAMNTIRDAASAAEGELLRRAVEGRIVDGHGDLRPEHICLSNPPCIIDALEFSQDLRILDPVEELAFLTLECELAGDVAAGLQVTEAYRRDADDPFGERLFDFYRSRRAQVRAKIMAWHVNDPVVMALAPWRERSEMYLGLAQRYAERALSTVR